MKKVHELLVIDLQPPTPGGGGGGTPIYELYRYAQRVGVCFEVLDPK